MGVLLGPIENELERFKWLVSDLEINTSQMLDLPINHEEDWFLISANEMEQLRASDAQIVWGVFAAVDRDRELHVTEETLPAAEGVPQIWKNGNLQVRESEIEIIAWDSSYTIIKFTDSKLSMKFKDYFSEAIELEKYQWKNRN